MKIGVDLDATVYGFPEFFRAFIPAMVAAGHEIYCTSAHAREDWPLDRDRLRALGIDPDMINPGHMQPRNVRRCPRMKARMANHLDIVFDDDAEAIQRYTRTPIFKPPADLAGDI